MPTIAVVGPSDCPDNVAADTSLHARKSTSTNTGITVQAKMDFHASMNLHRRGQWI
jgi:hypothetical protein